MYALGRMANADCTSILNTFSTSQGTSNWDSQQVALINGLNTQSTELTVTAVETPLSHALSCLQGEVKRLTDASSGISDLYDTKTALQKELKAKKEALQIAKDRAELLRNPEQKTTVYESWFPLLRPLNKITALLLLVFGLFFISVFTGLFMKYMGITVDISLTTRMSGIPGIPSWLSPYMNPVTLGLSAALIVSISTIIYLVTKKG